MSPLWTGPLDTLVLVDAVCYPRLIADLALVETAYTTTSGYINELPSRRQNIWEQARWRGQVVRVPGVRALEVHREPGIGNPPLGVELMADALPTLPPFRQWVVVVGNAQGWWGTGAVCSWTSALVPPCRPDEVQGLYLRFSGTQQLPQAALVPPPEASWTSADTHLRLICPQPQQRVAPGSEASWLLQYLAPPELTMPNIIINLMPEPWPLMTMRMLSPLVLELAVKMDAAFRGRAYFDFYAQAPPSGPKAFAMMTLDQF